MVPRQVLKRDAQVVDFDPKKIIKALQAAGHASGEFDANTAKTLADQVIAKLGGMACPGIEVIQNHAEDALVAAGLWRTARAYIVYREQHARLRDSARTLVDVESSMNEYLSRSD